MIRFLSFLLFCAVACLLCRCSAGPEVAGTVTETQNPGITSGRVIYNTGEPAKNAKVLFITASHEPLTGAQPRIDSCRTDDFGRYATNALPVGLFNLLASDNSDTLAYFKDSLSFTGDTLKIPDAVLLPRGSLCGRVELLPTDDPLSVTLYVVGTLVYSLPDSTGFFSLPSLAQGTYRLRFRSDDSKYRVFDTLLYVQSGVNRELEAPVVLPLKIPMPKGLSLSYDSLKQIVTLSWKAVPNANVRGYHVYRQRADTAEQRLTALPLRDTLFRDSALLQDSTYAYRITSVDSMGVEGVKTSGINVKAVSAFPLMETFGGAGSDSGRFDEISDLLFLKNGNLLVTDFRAGRVQVLDSTGLFLFGWGDSGTDNGQFNHPVAAVEDDSGNLFVLEMLGSGRLQKFSASGGYVASWPLGVYRSDMVWLGGRIFIANGNWSGYEIFDPATGSLTQISVTGCIPSFVQAGTHGNLYLGNSVRRIVEVDSSLGDILHQWNLQGLKSSPIELISDFVLDVRGGIYAAFGNGWVQRFDSTGTFKAALQFAPPRPGFSSPLSENSPRNMAVSRSGALYIADSHQIRKYSCP